MNAQKITKGYTFKTSNGTEWTVVMVKDGYFEARGFSANGRCVGIRMFTEACMTAGQQSTSHN